MAKKQWIQKATASIKRRGTEGVCTGSKFGSSSCPPGSRRYNLAKTFKKMAKNKKKQKGGEISSLPYETDPRNYAKDLYSHFSKNPDKYEMSEQSFEVTPETYEKYPNFSYARTLPVIPKRYTTGKDLETGEEFAYPAYSLEEIEEYDFGGIVKDTMSGAATGALTGMGAFGVAGGAALGLGKGLWGHLKEKKAERAEEERLASPHTAWANAVQNFQSSNNPYTATFPMGGEIPYPNVELEKEEVFQTPQGQMGQVDGPTHEQGGVPIALESGTRVWSDDLKAATGKTFAQEAEKIKKQMAKYEKILG